MDIRILRLCEKQPGRMGGAYGAVNPIVCFYCKLIGRAHWHLKGARLTLILEYEADTGAETDFSYRVRDADRFRRAGFLQ